MGSTNKTTNYELSQYIGTDKPSWLNDYNNDMLKIDTQMKANATAAGNAQTTANSADGKADSNTLAIGTLNTQINTPDTGLAATVAGHTTAITGINNTIGNTPLTTTAQTLTGAIEEVKGSIPSISGSLVTNGFKNTTVTADGVKSYKTLLNELYAAFLAYIAAKSASYRFMFSFLTISGVNNFNAIKPGLFDSSYNGGIPCITYGVAGTTVAEFLVVVESAGSCFTTAQISATPNVTNDSESVPAVGTTFTLTINEFTVNS